MLTKTMLIVLATLQAAWPEPPVHVRNEESAIASNRPVVREVTVTYRETPRGYDPSCSPPDCQRTMLIPKGLAKLSAAQRLLPDLKSYCLAMADGSSAMLYFRTQGVPLSQATEFMRFIADPQSKRLTSELVQYAWGQPVETPYLALRSELNELCLARKIFVL